MYFPLSCFQRLIPDEIWEICSFQFFTPSIFAGSSGILEFALIYDEINQLLLVNILRAKVGYQIMFSDKKVKILKVRQPWFQGKIAAHLSSSVFYAPRGLLKKLLIQLKFAFCSHEDVLG